METSYQVTPGCIVQIVGKTPLDVFKIGSYQYVKDVNCNGSVTICSSNGQKAYIDRTSCRMIEPYSKVTLKRYVKYIILYWLISNPIRSGKRTFKGIALASYVKNKIGNQNLYNPTVFAYMNQLTRENKIGTYSTVRQKSLYFCQWADMQYFLNYYN